jgi:hypothetical protein
VVLNGVTFSITTFLIMTPSTTMLSKTTLRKMTFGFTLKNEAFSKGTLHTYASMAVKSSMMSVVATIKLYNKFDKVEFVY